MKVMDSKVLQQIKAAAALHAVSFVKENMLIGLGTGSTATFFIQSLAKCCQEGLKIQAVASSEKSKKLASELGIPLIDIDLISSVDMTVDGADQIDKEKRMIKGGGGALLREKILASMSKEMVVVVDERKLVEYLGSCALPVEITPFAAKATLAHLRKLGYLGDLRKTQNQELFYTDNGNLIYDILIEGLLLHPEQDEEKIRHIPGVVETGFFFNLAGRIVVGCSDGTVKTL